MNNVLRLNSRIYSLSNIQNAINAYSGLCSVDFSIDGDYFICVFSECLYSIDLTINEFENYLISSTYAV
jgi:hypothetical protein